MSAGPPVRALSESLSGYLCGTHSGLLGRRRGERLGVEALAAAHRELRVEPAGEPVTLGGREWLGAPALAGSLRDALAGPEVEDLVLFGSQARGTTTGFSDVDAVLVVTDAAAGDAAALRALRPRVLRAQRAVLAHQPMQHHGFEVATPALLARAREALAMPAVALAETCSLGGREVAARFDAQPAGEARARLASVAAGASAAREWPRHPWALHRLVSMFELLPALYVQARGRAVAKHESFALAAADLGEAWRPYELLRELRERWPRRERPPLGPALRAARNPWVAVAAWRRLPARPPAVARELLDARCLEDLRRVAGLMVEGAA